MTPLSAFAAVFTVADVGAALGFYREWLGFAPGFLMGDPPQYAIIERVCVSLHLEPAARGAEALGLGAVPVFTPAVDALHAEAVAAGCPIERPPQDYPYGMREFSVRDPDGNRLTFGQSSGG